MNVLRSAAGAAAWFLFLVADGLAHVARAHEEATIEGWHSNSEIDGNNAEARVFTDEDYTVQ